MNHIYKSIFNKALGVFTAVPEFASAHGKGSERTVVGRVAKGAAGFAASALAISIGLALTSTSAVAYPGIYINDRQAGNCLAINDTAVANLGVGTILDVNSTPGSVELKVPGTYAPQTGITPSYYNAAGSARPCAAIGNSTVDNRETQTNRTLFYGGPGAATEADEVNNENNGAKNLTLGGRLDVNSGIIGVGDRGTNGAGATNSIRMGMGTALSDANKQVDAITIGVNAGASAKHATAIGSATTAKTGYSTALGYKAQAGDPAVTLLNGEYATAIGGVAKALNAQTTAVGAESVAAGVGQTSIGAYAGKNGTGDQVAQSYGVFIGRFAGSDNQNPNAATEGGNNYGISIGESAGRYGQGGTRNTAIGEQAGQYLKGSYNIAMGSNAGSGTAAETLEVTNTAAIGNTAKALTEDSIAIGRETESGKVDRFDGKKSIAIGTKAKALGTETIAIGALSSATNGHNTIALGAYAHASAEKAISIGAFNTASGVQSIVIAGNYDTGTGSNRSTATAARAIVMGVESHATAADTLTIGSKNKVASARTYAIGNNIDVKAGADDSLVFGTRASVAGVNTIAMGNTTQASANYAIAVGNTAQATAEHATAIGNKSVASNVSAIALGRQAQATDENAVALGADSKADGHSSFAGAVGASSAGTRQVSIGHYAGNNTQGSSTPAKPADHAVFIGNYAGSDAAGTNGNTNGVAIGSEAGRYLQSGSNNTAIGSQAGQYVEGSLNSSLGQGAGKYVKGDNNIAMGTQAGTGTAAEKLEVSNTTSIGNAAKALTDDSISIGRDSKAGKVDKFDGKKSIAIGYASEAMGSNAIALGSNAATNNGHDSIAMGTYAKTNGEKTISIGAYNTAEGAQSIVIAGNYDASTGSNRSTTTAAAKRAIVVGPESHATAEDAVAIGNKNTVASARTYAMGNNINVAGEANDSIVMGSSAAAYSGNQINIGTKAGADAAQASGTTPAANNKYGIAIGFEAGRYQQGVVGGSAAKNLEAYNTAIGYQSGQYVKGYSNIALGNNAGSGTQDNVLEARYTVSIGDYAKATKNYATAIGQGAQANSVNSVALGLGANVATNAPDSLAFGTKAAVSAENTVAIGKNANAAQANSVALGAGSTTADVHTGDYTLNGSYTAAGLPKVANGTVSVGSAGKERQIQNVAAGVISATSTDAINGSQLYATNNYLSNLAGGVKNVLGGDAAVDNAGNLTMSNIGGTGKGNVNDAIAAANTKVAAGDNITVTPTTNADGSKTYTVATKKDLVVDSVKAGDTTVNTDGVTIANGPSVKKDGINAGDKKITGVADGNVAAGSKEAVNGGQLAEVKAKADSAVQNVVSTNPTALTANKVGDTVTLTPNFIAGDLVNADGTVKDPAAADEGKLVSAKTVADALKANHFVVDTKANGGTVDAASEENAKVGSGNKVTFEAGKNLVAQQTNTANGGAKVNYKLSDTLENLVSVKSAEIEAGIGPNKVVLNNNGVKVGDSTLNDKGLTINNGPSVTDAGIDAGNKKITGVADGNVAAGSTDAVNGGQLAEVKAKADSAVQDIKSGDEKALSVTKAGNTYTITPNLSGDLVDANGNITAPATPEDKGKLVTAGTVAEALANTHFVVNTEKTDGGELDTASQANQKIKAGNKVTLQAGKNLKAKQTNGANGAEVEFSLKDSISLKEVKVGEGSANEVVLNNNGVNVAGNTYINNAGLNANGNKITNVADGVDPTDAVNKSQLDAVKGVADSAVKSVDVANGEQNLVVDNSDPKNPKLSLKKDLTVDSVKAGDSTLNNDGLTIAGGPSVKKDGINAGDKTITNVAPGAVTPTSKDAVNGGQLYNVANNVKDLIGPDATIDPATGKVAVADPVKGIGETGKGNIGDAIKHVNDAAKAAADTAKKHTTVEQGDNILVEESLNADGGKHYKVSTARDLNVDSVKAGDTTVNNDGVTIAGGPSVTKGGINAGGNTITNVADGVNDTDAVNKGQLNAVKNVADSAVKSVDVANGEENLVVDNTDSKNPKLSLKKDLTVDSVKAGDTTVNNDGLTIAGGPSVTKDGINAGDKKITNVAAGDVAENSKDAVNGGQLYDVAKNVADLVGPDAKIDPATGKVTVTDPAKGIGETGKGNIGDAIKHVNDLAKNAADTAKKHTTVEQGDNIVVEESTNAEGGKHYKVSTARDLNVDSVKAGDTTVNNDGVTIAGGPSVTKGGINAGGNTITNVADGVNDTDAVNKGQLNKVDTKVSNVAQNVVNVLGGDAAVNGNGDITMSNIGETGKGNINDAIKSVNDLAKKAAAEKTSVKAKEGRSNVTVTEGVNAAGGHEYTVDVERSVTNAGSDYVTVTNNHDADTNTTTYTVDVSAKTKASLAKADSAVQGLTSKDGNLNFTKGANGNVEVSFNDNLNVKNVTTDRVQVANGPSMSKDGINAAGKAISNVANGNVAADSKDAVNGGQLHETAKSVADVIGGGATVKDGKVVAGQNGIGNTGQNTVHGAIAAINQNTANNFNQIRGDLRKMDRDLRGGIAGALATAGLPQAFRPGKSMVAAAASTYRGQSGLAIGVSRISDNGKVILKVTGNTNSRGDFGGTIGAGYQW